MKNETTNMLLISGVCVSTPKLLYLYLLVRNTEYWRRCLTFTFKQRLTLRLSSQQLEKLRAVETTNMCVRYSVYERFKKLDTRADLLK